MLTVPEPAGSDLDQQAFCRAELRLSLTSMWLSIVAYMVRAGAYLGLVQTESDDPDHRAYVRAHQALLWLRTQLAEGQVVAVEEQCIRLTVEGQERQLLALPGLLQLSGPPLPQARLVAEHFFEPQALDSVNLGPQGWARFRLDHGQLHCQLEAYDESSGRCGRHASQLTVNLMHRKQRAPRPV